MRYDITAESVCTISRTTIGIIWVGCCAADAEFASSRNWFSFGSRHTKDGVTYAETSRSVDELVAEAEETEDQLDSHRSLDRLDEPGLL